MTFSISFALGNREITNKLLRYQSGFRVERNVANNRTLIM